MAELIWDGKYDKDGRKVAPPRVALPFQTVETVNETAQERQRTLDLFTTGRDPDWRNRLVWGDKKYVLPSLLPEFAGKVDLIYIDPPFDTGADFSLQIRVDGEEFTKEPSVIEQKAYRDTWGEGIDSYLRWFFDTTQLLREILSKTGSIYVHLDDHLSHYAKAILDEVFGSDNYRNEIAWSRTNARSTNQQWPRLHDVILFYSASPDFVFSQTLLPAEQSKMPHTLVTGPDGQKYQTFELTAPGRTQQGQSGLPWRGFDPSSMGRHWANTQTLRNEWDTNGLIHWPQGGGFPRRRAERPFDHSERVITLGDVWTDVDRINQAANERLRYPTQKPEALLERVLKASSNEGDLILDCFCGSGTTPAVAEKLGRRWIAADLGRFAIHTTRKRLLGIPDVKPFVVQNLGKYERQVWQTAEFGDQAEARQLAYRKFILDLYRARPINGYAWLHGLRNGRMVHVGSVDAPVSPGDVTQIVAEFRKTIGTGADAPTTSSIDILGWDFAFELHEVARQQAALARVDARFVRIPRDVMDKRAVEQGDIDFFELAALNVDVATKGRALTVTLIDFVIPLDDVPADVQKAITNWAQWIDYWAVDWDNRSDTFHNQWQTYRTRQNRDLQKSASYTYPEPGRYRVVVKVIDILGNDTTKVLTVEVP